MKLRTLVGSPWLILLASSLTLGQAPNSNDVLEIQQGVVAHHAAWCHSAYTAVSKEALELQCAVERFLDQPEEALLSAARVAWIDARRAYGVTEVLRFHDGPIEPLEPLLNAWPVDEAFIDYVVGRKTSGIIHDVAGYPSLGGAVLEMANERGGEANICVGWHAIEFMLWGQDLSTDGPGARPATDFQDGAVEGASRRREYLSTVTQLLVDHLALLEAAWRPNQANYRARFEAEQRDSTRRILVGATVLSAFELGGERLTVAFDTQDQEQEHSCFSDQTCQDFIANQVGLMQAIKGTEVNGKSGPGLLKLIHAHNPQLAAAISASLDKTERCIRAIPQPFDQAILGSDESEGRKAIAAAILALEEQTDVLLIAGKELGFNLPLEPGG